MRHSKRSLEGEILIDHRASPGLTPEDLQGFGLAIPKGEVFESSIYVCAHCQLTVVNNPPGDRQRARAWCAKCDKYICVECEALMAITLECRSFERRIDQLQDEIERSGSSTLLLTRL